MKCYSEADLDRIKNLYENEKWGSVKIATEFGSSHKTILSILRKLDIPVKKVGNRCKAVNENFFERIDTEAKAYYLGLLYADGCIKDTPSNYQKKLYISLQWEDRYILEKFINRIELDNSVRFKVRDQPQRKDQGTVSISSDKLCNDLIRLGCVPRKSLVLQFPADNLIPINLMNHFCRGLFDGDGCITGNKKFTFSFTGTESVCSGLQSQLMRFVELNKTKLTPIKSQFLLNYSGNINCRKLYNFLYCDATLFLARKEEKFRKLFDMPTKIKNSQINRASKPVLSLD